MTNLPELSGPGRTCLRRTSETVSCSFRFWCRRKRSDLAGPVFRPGCPGCGIYSPGSIPVRGSPFGYQWYDVWMQDRDERLAAIRSTAAIFDNFINQQLTRHGLTEKDLVLVGFSQGTMMSLFTAPRRALAVAGIVGYSGRMEAPDLL